MNDHANRMFRANRKKKKKTHDGSPIILYPADPEKDELIGRLKASLEWSQRETQEHKIMMDQNALFRRVAELTNERNALQAGFCPALIAAQDDLEVALRDLCKLREELEKYKAQHNHPNPADIYLKCLPTIDTPPNQITILEGNDGETVYTYIDGEWVAERPANG